MSWQMAAGETRTLRASCLDFSAHGARIECSQRIGSRTTVYVQAPAYGLMGSATVRYCRSQGVKYQIGLEFTWAADLVEAARKKVLESS